MRPAALLACPLLFACQVTASSSRAAAGLPELCNQDPDITEAVGAVRLRLVAPAGRSGEGRECRGAARDLLAHVDRVIDRAPQMPGSRVDYEASIEIPAYQPAPLSEWLVIPPPLRTRDGVVLRVSHEPALSADRYRVAASSGSVTLSRARVLRLQVDAVPDEEPPVLSRLDAGMALVEQGGTLTVSASILDGQSGTLMPLAGAPLLTVEVARVGLLDRITRRTFPLGALTAPIQSVNIPLPGYLPAGLYDLVAEAVDQVGNRVRWQGDPSAPLEMARYVALREPVCRRSGPPEGPVGTPVPLTTVIVGSLMGVDQVPPRLLRLDTLGGEVRDGVAHVKPCQELILRMEIDDERALPATQRALIWVGPLSGGMRAALDAVPAEPRGRPGQIEARFIVPGDATPGPWIFLPAYVEDAARNPLIGEYRAPPEGSPPGTSGLIVRLDPLLASETPLPVAPARFQVLSHDGKTASDPDPMQEAAMLEEVLLLDEEPGATRVRGGRPVRLRVSYSRNRGGLPAAAPR